MSCWRKRGARCRGRHRGGPAKNPSVSSPSSTASSPAIRVLPEGRSNENTSIHKENKTSSHKIYKSQETLFLQTYKLFYLQSHVTKKKKAKKKNTIVQWRKLPDLVWTTAVLTDTVLFFLWKPVSHRVYYLHLLQTCICLQRHRHGMDSIW